MEEHCVVGTGAESSWHRPTNAYPGCTCPPFRYSPAHIHKRATSADCPQHGGL